jgi:pimeloyl-ACP methyl ester carboxylesterase
VGAGSQQHPHHAAIRTNLANGNKVFYIGHSWGAQEGWCTLHEPGLADAFISLETTMEWKTDTAEVRDKWPHVLDAITTAQLCDADPDGGRYRRCAALSDVRRCAG